MKRNFHEPRHDTTIASIARQAPVNQDERILGDVRSFHGIPGQTESERDDFRPMSAEEPVKGGFVLSASEESCDLRVTPFRVRCIHSYVEG